MTKSFRCKLPLILIAAAVAMVLPLSANQLSPGSCVGLGTSMCPGSVEDLAPLPAGSILADTGAETLVGKDNNGNTVWTSQFEQVVASDAATGGLDFIYQVQVGGGPDNVGRLTTTNFAGFTTDVGTCLMCNPLIGTVLGGDIPDDISRSSTINGGIAFAYDLPSNHLAPGQETVDLVIRTNASSYILGSSQLIDGGVATAASYSPAMAPEPAVVGLLASGLLGIGLTLRRRNRK